MIAEGLISVELARDGAVHLRSSRAADVGKLLSGREPEEVLTLLPMIFSLCGQAHVAAARRALSGLGFGAEKQVNLVPVLAENAREHLLRIALGWRIEGSTTDFPVKSIMPLVNNFHAAAGSEAAHLAEVERLEELLEAHVFGATPAWFLGLETETQLHDWASSTRTIAMEYLAQTIQSGWQGLGAIPARFLPDMPEDHLMVRLVEPGYVNAPDWLGEPYETGPLARQQSHPLVAAILAGHGAGFLARLVARLVDLAKIPAQMRRGATAPSGANGIGVVETARGRLIHAIRLRDGVIGDYRILAPTEWNFHRNGAAVQALQAVPQGPDRVKQASLLIQAIDPCVAFEVRVA